MTSQALPHTASMRSKSIRRRSVRNVLLPPAWPPTSSARSARAAVVAATLISATLLPPLIFTFAPDAGLQVFIAYLTIVGASAAYFVARRDPIPLFGLTIIAGFLQQLIASVHPNNAAFYIDDLLMGCAIIVLLLQRRAALQGKKTAVVFILLAAVIILLWASIRSPDLRVGLLQARQLGIPIALLACGALLYHDDVIRLCRVVVRLALLNAAYVIAERIYFPFIDPVPALLANSDGRQNLRNGLPSNYYYFTHEGVEPILRAGGLMLNPTTSGLFIGLGVIALVVLRPPGVARTLGLMLLGVSLALTISRGGMLIAVVPLLFVPMYSMMRARLATALLAVTIAGAGIYIARQAGSSAHVEGLIAGFSTMLADPFGVGFGTVGNYAAAVNYVSEGDSLGGVALAALGVVAAIPMAWFARRVINQLLCQSPRSGRADKLLTIFTAALFIAALTSETSAAGNATVFAWLAAGSTVLGGQQPIGAPSPAHQGPTPRHVAADDAVANGVRM